QRHHLGQPAAQRAQRHVHEFLVVPVPSGRPLVAGTEERIRLLRLRFGRVRAAPRGPRHPPHSSRSITSVLPTVPAATTSDSAWTCAPGSHSESSTATAEKPADHQKAWWNAPVGAVGCAAIAPSRITARTAVPNEPPICCA